MCYNYFACWLGDVGEVLILCLWWSVLRSTRRWKLAAFDRRRRRRIPEVVFEIYPRPADSGGRSLFFTGQSTRSGIYHRTLTRKVSANNLLGQRGWPWVRIGGWPLSENTVIFNSIGKQRWYWKRASYEVWCKSYNCLQWIEYWIYIT